MSNNIYVGNLSPSTTREEIRQLFEQYGKVDSVESHHRSIHGGTPWFWLREDGR
jgi:RNA recognition motif-containing protein